MAKAVTADDVTGWLSDVPGMEVPSNLTTARVESVIEAATAHVLSTRDHDSLPDEGTDERRIVNDAVLELSLNKLQRRLFPDNAEFLDALRRERKRIEEFGEETETPDLRMDLA